jgi:hypothetical protein
VAVFILHIISYLLFLKGPVLPAGSIFAETVLIADHELILKLAFRDVFKLINTP